MSEVDNAKQMFVDNSHIILTETLQWKNVPGQSLPAESPVLSMHYSDKSKLLFVTKMGDHTYIGRLSEDFCEVMEYFDIEPTANIKDSKQLTDYQKNGSTLINFTDLPQDPESGNFQILALNKKLNAPQSVPVVLQIKESEV